MEKGKIIDFEKGRDDVELNPELVRCTNCGKLINMHATRCEHCKIHFDGAAMDFAPMAGTNTKGSFGAKKAMKLIVIGLLVIAGVMILKSLLPF